MKYTAKVQFFFQKLKTNVKIAKNRALYRVAGYVRTASKRAIRRRDGPSEPTKPPHAHTASGLRAIEFVVDEAASAAIIGPIKFPGSNFFNEPVPFIHEFGGSFMNSRGISHYPERSYMNYTLKKLVASGKIPKEFSVGMARIL